MQIAACRLLLPPAPLCSSLSAVYCLLIALYYLTNPLLPDTNETLGDSNQ